MLYLPQYMRMLMDFDISGLGLLQVLDCQKGNVFSVQEFLEEQ